MPTTYWPSSTATPHQQSFTSTGIDSYEAKPTESYSSVVSSCVDDYFDFVNGLLVRWGCGDQLLG